MENVEGGKRGENGSDDFARVSWVSELVDSGVEYSGFHYGAERQCTHEVVLQCLDLWCHALAHDLVHCLPGDIVQSHSQGWIGRQRLVMSDWIEDEAQ